MQQNNYKDINELKVFKNDLFVGYLRRTHQGVELAFDQIFFNTHKTQNLTYKTKVSSLVLNYNGLNLPPFFAGLLPEGLRLKALVKELKTSEDDMFTMLVAVGHKVIGDVYIGSDVEKGFGFFNVKKVQDVNFYEVFFESIQDLNQLHFSESYPGVQEKISASMISFPLKMVSKEKSYILKLNPKDKPTLVHNEYACLNLAKKCGFKVNNARLVLDKDQNPGLLVERFDRIYDKLQSKEIKIHQEDACQFLDRYPADKYRLSMQDICKAITDISSAPVLEILNLTKMYIFNYLICNGDFHAKNISLFTDPKTQGVVLTPMYDVISTLIYGDDSMALKLDGRDSNFKRKNFIDFALRYSIPEGLMNREVDKILKNVVKNYELLLQIPNLTEKNKNHLKQTILQRVKDLE